MAAAFARIPFAQGIQKNAAGAHRADQFRCFLIRKKARAILEWLLAQDAVHAIASDAHDPKLRRPVLSEARNAVAKILGEDAADQPSR